MKIKINQVGMKRISLEENMINRGRGEFGVENRNKKLKVVGGCAHKIQSVLKLGSVGCDVTKVPACCSLHEGFRVGKV